MTTIFVKKTGPYEATSEVLSSGRQQLCPIRAKRQSTGAALVQELELVLKFLKFASSNFIAFIPLFSLSHSLPRLAAKGGTKNLSDEWPR